MVIKSSERSVSGDYVRHPAAFITGIEEEYIDATSGARFFGCLICNNIGVQQLTTREVSATVSPLACTDISAYKA